MKEAWEDIEKALRSKKTKWQSGTLQKQRAQAIECHLRLTIGNKYNFTEASKVSAEAHRFSISNGSRLLRSWTRK